MARPERHDADYFPFYARDGRTLFILESKYQCKGTGFFTNVMRFLTLQADHYFCIKAPEDRLYFFSKCKCDEVSGADMLDMMSLTGKIDKELWVSASVIVSQDLLSSLEKLYLKRKNKMITIAEIKEKYVSGIKNPVSGDINPQADVVSEHINTQSKVKYSKVKESITENVSGGGIIEPKKELVIKKLQEAFLKFPNMRYQQQIKVFVEANLFKKNGDAIIQALNSLIKSQQKIINPKMYLEKVLAVENGNFNEQESVKEHEEHKKPIPIGGIPGLGEVLKTIGGAAS